VSFIFCCVVVCGRWSHTYIWFKNKIWCKPHLLTAIVANALTMSHSEGVAYLSTGEKRNSESRLRAGQFAACNCGLQLRQHSCLALHRFHRAGTQTVPRLACPLWHQACGSCSLHASSPALLFCITPNELPLHSILILERVKQHANGGCICAPPYLGQSGAWLALCRAKFKLASGIGK
jgi:hypothetical protein